MFKIEKQNGKLYVDSDLLLSDRKISKKEIAIALYPLMQQLEWSNERQLLALRNYCSLTLNGARTYLNNLKSDNGIWNNLVA